MPNPYTNTLVDRTGQTFNRLTIIKRTKCPLRFAAKQVRNRAWYVVRCVYGVEKSVQWEPIRAGRTKSCGCLRDEMAKISIEKIRTIRHPKTQNGASSRNAPS